MRENLTEDLDFLAHQGIARLRNLLDGVRGASRRGRCRRRGARASTSRCRSPGRHRGEAVATASNASTWRSPPSSAGAGAGNVLHAYRGRRHLLGADELREPLEPVVGDRRHADVRLVRLDAYAVISAPAFVNALKSVVLPALGSPTMPTSSATAAKGTRQPPTGSRSPRSAAARHGTTARGGSGCSDGARG